MEINFVKINFSIIFEICDLRDLGIVFCFLGYYSQKRRRERARSSNCGKMRQQPFPTRNEQTALLSTGNWVLVSRYIDVRVVEMRRRHA